MARLMDKIRNFMNSPRGRQAVSRAKTMARDPRNQQKARGFMERLRNRTHRPH